MVNGIVSLIFLSVFSLLVYRSARDFKGTLHAKMGSIKDRNGRDLTETEDIKKRWQEYTELYKKDLHDLDNHNSVITHPLCRQMLCHLSHEGIP